MNPWNDDAIQFARLLAEINATQELNLEELCDSMSLTEDEVNQLFERAHEAWEKIKEEHCPS
jgi:hypothetical protein